MKLKKKNTYCRSLPKWSKIIYPPMVLSKIFGRSIQGIATWNSREKIKLVISHEQNYATWLVKNDKTVFSKLKWKISCSPCSFTFSEFQILSGLLGCYFSEINCIFCLRQMFNGLQFSCTTVRLSKERFLFAIASDPFQ